MNLALVSIPYLLGGICLQERAIDVFKINSFICKITDAYTKKGIMIYPGKKLISEHCLYNAFKKKLDNFRTNHLEYFYYATKHWKVTSNQCNDVSD